MDYLPDDVFIHFGSLLAPAVVLLQVVVPGETAGSPLHVFFLLSLLLTAAALLLSLQLLPPSLARPAEVSIESQLYVYLVSVAFYQLMGILLGANPISQFWRTLIWSSLMTTLTSHPTTLLLGTHWNSWSRIFLHRGFQNHAEQRLYIMVAMTIVGAWLGAVPIPLDWDRPWQVWPVPCCYGAVAGSLIGSVSSLFLARPHSIPRLALNLSAWKAI